MSDAARARKLAVRIRQVVAETLEHQVKDARLAMVTVTDTRVTADLHEATVFYTVYGEEQARNDSRAALESAKGLVRSAVGKATGVRFTPTVTFIEDALPDTAKHISELLERARAADAVVADVRAGAVPAGDADPYRHPVEPEEQ